MEIQNIHSYFRSHTNLRPQYELQLVKGKWYVRMPIPEILKQFYSSQRYKRRSTGTSDYKLAIKFAPGIAEKIYLEYEHKSLSLDQSIEEVKIRLSAFKCDFSNWYSDGYAEIVAPSYVGVFRDEVVYRIEEKHAFIEFFALLKLPLPKQLQACLSATQADPHVAFNNFEKAMITDELLEIATKFPNETRSKEGKEALKLGPEAVMQAGQVTFTSYLPRFFSIQSSTYYNKYRREEPKKQVNTRRADCFQFIEFVGDFPLSEYRAQHGYRYAKMLSEQGFANSTIRRKVGYVADVFNIAVQDIDRNFSPALSQNPFVSLNLTSYGRAPTKVVGYTMQQLEALFSVPKMRDFEFVFLATLLCTGMRLDELALMTRERVIKIDGILCFSLRFEDAGKDDPLKLKNAASERYVPIPSILENFYSPSGKSIGRLFAYRLDQDGKAENAASKSLMRLIRQIPGRKDGLNAAANGRHERQNIHSLRHTAKTLYRETETQEYIIDAAMAHTSAGTSSVARRYGENQFPQLFKTLFDSVKHPWIENSEKYRWLTQRSFKI